MDDPKKDILIVSVLDEDKMKKDEPVILLSTIYLFIKDRKALFSSERIY